MLEYKDSKS